MANLMSKWRPAPSKADLQQSGVTMQHGLTSANPATMFGKNLKQSAQQKITMQTFNNILKAAKQNPDNDKYAQKLSKLIANVREKAEKGDQDYQNLFLNLFYRFASPERVEKVLGGNSVTPKEILKYTNPNNRAYFATESNMKINIESVLNAESQSVIHTDNSDKTTLSPV